MAKIGYLRVSTNEQRPDRQIKALRSICDEMHIETLSALSRKRPVYQKVMQKLKAGDTLVIWEVSRAWRSMKDAVLAAENLKNRGIFVQIGTMVIDFSIPDMEFAFFIMAAPAHLEISKIKVRTSEGMEVSREQGIHLGRLSNDALIAAHAAITNGNETVASMAGKLGCSEETLLKGFKRLGLE